MKKFRLICTATITAASLLGGCAGPEAQPYYSSQPYSPPLRQDYNLGVVDRIEVIRQTVTQDNITDLRTGDRVRVEGDRIFRT